MPKIRPIRPITYNREQGNDITDRIAPPYDVLDEHSKNALLSLNDANIVAVDLPHLPPKTVGPDSAYAQAAETLGKWISEGKLSKSDEPAIFVYQQTYTVRDRKFQRRGIIANAVIRQFGEKPADGAGGIFAHEQTFSEPKEDRLKLMRATKAQLSPIFGLFDDPSNDVGPMLADVIEKREADFAGKTANDDVLHEVWIVSDSARIDSFAKTLEPCDTFIADGHHRYTTALNYKQEQGDIAQDHAANNCLFVLVAMQDEGLIVLPTHRVLGGMPDFDMQKFKEAAKGQLEFKPFEGGTIEQLEAVLPAAGSHAMGIYDPSDGSMYVVATATADPLAEQFPEKSEAWRQLDVAILQHLIVEKICEPTFAAGGKVSWKFPHTLADSKAVADSDGYQLCVVMQATPLASIGSVCRSGELMPQKSTYFYPKLATGLVINPIG